jgi:UDP-glucose 4-epimerase
MHVLVTGGHGFIGQHLVPVLLHRSHTVTVIDLLPQPTALQRLQYVFQRGDILDDRWLRSVWPANVDAVIHLVALPNMGAAQTDPDRSFNLSVLSLERVLERCRATRPRMALFPSAAAVYGSSPPVPATEDAAINPTNIYSYHKRIGELLLQSYAESYGFGWTVLRLYNVYGRGQQGVIGFAVKAARTGQVFKLSGGEQLRDFVYVGDVAEAFALAVETPSAANRAFNIGSGMALTIRQIVAVVKELYPMLTVEEVAATGAAFHAVSDNRLARQVLGWRPHDSLEFLKERIAQEMSYD